MRYAQGGGFDAAGRARREQVRMRAAELIDAGHRDAEIAKALRVTPESVCRWRAAYRDAGAAGLATKGHGGRQTYLTDMQIGQLTAALDQGPGAHGHLEDQRWTLARIGDLIEAMFGVRYKDSSTISRLLRKAGYSWQVPARCAAERDEQAITAWREQEPAFHR
jgi:transposase